MAIKDGFNLEQSAADTIYTHIVNNSDIDIREIISIYNNTKKKHISNFNEETKYLITAQDITIVDNIPLIDLKPNKLKLNLKI